MKAFSSLLAARLRRDERGAGVVELALLLPVLALLTVGIADFSHGLSERMRIHRAVQQSLEIAAAHRMAVSPDSDLPTYDFLAKRAAQAAEVPEAQVTLTKWLECNGVKQGFDGSCGDGQSIARYVEIHIVTHFSPMFNYGPLARAAGGGDAPRGTIPLFAKAAVRVQ